MTKERDYLRSIFNVALVWVLTIVIHQIIYTNTWIFQEYMPNLLYYVNSGFLTLFIAIIGTIIAWWKTGQIKQGDKSKEIIEASTPKVISKNEYLLNRLDELLAHFPIKINEFQTTIHNGVISYRRKKSLPHEIHYYFEDYTDMDDFDYNLLCFMRNEYDMSQRIYEDLAFIKGNDVPLYYEMKDILSYFKTKYHPDKLSMEKIGKEIIYHNWEMARYELNRVHESKWN